MHQRSSRQSDTIGAREARRGGRLSTSITPAIPHIRAGIREDHRGILDRHTLIYAGIGHKRCRVLVGAEPRTAIGDGDDSTVLVHLAIAKEVEPRP
jgi:hypothetical protein